MGREKTQNFFNFVPAIGKILLFKSFKSVSETTSKGIDISIQSLLSVRGNCKQNAN